MAKTLVAHLQKRVAHEKERPACRQKNADSWQTVTWGDFYQQVQALAQGLRQDGVAPGDKIALLCNTRMEWMVCDMAIMSLGAVTVPIYTNVVKEEVQYILQNSQARFLIVEDALQLAQVRELGLEDLNKVIIVESIAPPPDKVETYAAALERGRANTDWSALQERIDQVKPTDLATIVYTSGTSGPPKGAMLTHSNIVAAIEGFSAAIQFYEDDSTLTFLPFAHMLGRMEGFISMYHGLLINYAQNIQSVATDMAATHPTIIVGVPRFFEKIYARILGALDQGSPLKQRLFNWALGVGRQVSQCLQQKQPIPLGLRLQHTLAHTLVFKKLHQRVGGRIRFFMCGGAPLSRTIIEFFHAVGLLILEGYGLTESMAASFINRPDNYRFGSVGQPTGELECKLAPDGEILLRGPVLFQGYYRQPERTRRVMDAEGWYHTGDIGKLDADGFLTIIDRKKNLIVTSGGKNIAPQNIENLLKEDPLISQVMCYGDKRKYLTALITINQRKVLEEIGEQSLSPEKVQEGTPAYEAIARRVAACNAKLPSYQQIKHFKILLEDFSIENGMLTPSLKIKRKVITARYQKELDAMYAEKYD